MLFWYSAFLRYKRPEAHILSPNLSSALLDPRKIDDKLSNNLVTRSISQVSSSPPFVYSLLELVPKNDGRFQKIYHFSFPEGSSVNDYIPKKAVHLYYTALNNVFQKVEEARRHYIIIKCDIKNAFGKIPLAPKV